MDLRQMIREEISSILSQYDLEKFKIPTVEEIAKQLTEKEIYQNNAKFYLGRFSLIYISTLSILFGSNYILSKYAKTSQMNYLQNILNTSSYITLVGGAIGFFVLCCTAYDIQF